MFRNIFLKTLYNLRWQMLLWSLAVAATALITMSVYTSFSQNGVEDILASLPDSLKGIVGSVEDFKTVPGFIGQQIFGPNIITLTIIMSLLLFFSVSANDEDRGGLQTLLSMPVSRTTVYFQKLGAVLVVIAVVATSIMIGTWIGLLSIGETANYGRILQSVVGAWLVNAAFGMTAYSLAMATGKKGLSIALAGGYAFMCLVVTSLAPAVDSLATLDKFSLLHYYNTPLIMQNGLSGVSLLVLVGSIALLTYLGWLGFTKRSIRT